MNFLGYELFLRHFPAEYYRHLIPLRLRIKMFLLRRKVRWITLAVLMEPPEGSPCHHPAQLGLGVEVRAVGKAFCNGTDPFDPRKGEYLAIKRAFRAVNKLHPNSEGWGFWAWLVRDRYFVLLNRATKVKQPA